MKNFWLAVILVVLLIATYVFQERHNQEVYHAETSEGLVLTAPITKLKWGNVDAVKKGEQWWMGDRLLSHNTFKQLAAKLARVRKAKDLAEASERYFTESTVVEVNGEAWKFGDMTMDKQGFYFQQGSKTMVAYLDVEGQSMTQDPTEIEGLKLAELKSLLAANPFETQLFRFYPKLPFEKVVIESDGLPKFELDFMKNTTLPAPIKGVHAHEQLQQKFLSLLTQATIQEEVPFQAFAKKMASVTFTGGGQTLTWELWFRSKAAADPIIVDPAAKRAWHMIGGTLKIFFAHLQDFWDKKIIPHEKFTATDKFSMTLSQGTKSDVVTIFNAEPLKFEAKAHKVKTEMMNGLVFLLFNLKEKDQADRVSELSTSDRKQFLAQENLHIQLLDQDLILVRKAQEIIVANLTQGFKAHFHLLDENFRGKFEDVLE